MTSTLNGLKLKATFLSLLMLMVRKPSSPFLYTPGYPQKWVAMFRLWFLGKKLWRWFRVQKPVTKLLGYHYSVATDLLEIDITYQCNLKCNNCNRSSAQAVEARHIAVPAIREFVTESLEQGRVWRRIRILGGEPTLHPELAAILDELYELKMQQPDTVIQLVTNGYGRRVARVLTSLPAWLEIENSTKTDNLQPEFGPFNLAPKDSWYHRHSDFANGCDIASSCGIGLTPQGFYPCAVAGGIDRVMGLQDGRAHLPDPHDEMRDLMVSACALCGRFRDGHYVPPKLRPRLYHQQTSPSWEIIYQQWSKRRSRTLGLEEMRNE